MLFCTVTGTVFAVYSFNDRFFLGSGNAIINDRGILRVIRSIAVPAHFFFFLAKKRPSVKWFSLLIGFRDRVRLRSVAAGFLVRVG